MSRRPASRSSLSGQGDPVRRYGRQTRSWVSSYGDPHGIVKCRSSRQAAPAEDLEDSPRSSASRWTNGEEGGRPDPRLPVQGRQLDKEAREKIHELNRKIAHFAMGHQLEDLKEKYRRTPHPDYLTGWRRISWESQGIPRPDAGAAVPIEGMDKASFLERYRVNVLVDNANTQGGRSWRRQSHL